MIQALADVADENIFELAEDFSIKPLGQEASEETAETDNPESEVSQQEAAPVKSEVGESMESPGVVNPTNPATDPGIEKDAKAAGKRPTPQHLCDRCQRQTTPARSF